MRAISITSRRELAAVVISFILVMAGGGLGYYVLGDQINIYQHSQSKPTPITAANLATDGPPKDNWHVLISNYSVKDFEVSWFRGWTSMSCELVPVPAISHQKRTISLFTSVKSKEEAQEIANRKTIDAYVSPGLVDVSVNYVGSDHIFSAILFVGFCTVFCLILGILLIFGVLTGKLS